MGAGVCCAAAWVCVLYVAIEISLCVECTMGSDLKVFYLVCYQT